VLKHCEGTGRVKQYSIIDNYCAPQEFVVFNTNISNLARAVNERLFYRCLDGVWQRPHEADEVSVNKIITIVDKELRDLLPSTAPMSYEDFILGYTGRKRQVYQEAIDSLKQFPLQKKDWELQAFGKVEKLALKEDPSKMIMRVIQTRSPRYHASLGIYTRKVEHDIYLAVDAMVRRGSKGILGEKTILKGLNCIDQATHIVNKFRRFHNPVVISADAKRFDHSVGAIISKLEHQIYAWCFKRKKDREILMELLSKQLENVGRGFCRDGKLKYKLGPSRCSGDMNTGLGNCVLMTVMMYCFLKHHLKIDKFAVADNGDDVFIIVEQELLSLVQDNMYNYFYELGFIMEIEEPVYQIEQISFCQTQPVFDGERYRMVRNPHHSLTKDAISIKPFQSQMEMANFLHSVGEGGLSLTGGLPVLQDYYQSMINNSIINNPTNKKFKDILTERDGFYWQRRGMSQKYKPVSEAARASFAIAFGIMPDVQAEMEEYYSKLIVKYQNDPMINSTRGEHKYFF